MIVGMKELIDHATDLGVDNVVMGMPHRGRLNVNKPAHRCAPLHVGSVHSSLCILTPSHTGVTWSLRLRCTISLGVMIATDTSVTPVTDDVIATDAPPDKSVVR